MHVVAAVPRQLDNLPFGQASQLVRCPYAGGYIVIDGWQTGREVWLPVVC